MQPWLTIDRARAHDGTELLLARRGDEWVVRCDGRVLMSSRQHGSEEALAQRALERVRAPLRVFVGGLGLGFTARAALDRMPVASELVVAELTPAIADWNRAHVGGCAGRPLEDARTQLVLVDAVAHLRSAAGRYDAILLDIDNGPSALVHASNERLYGERGVASCYAALRPGGALAVWSAGPDGDYLARLSRAGFRACAEPVSARGGHPRGVRHVLFVATRDK